MKHINTYRDPRFNFSSLTEGALEVFLNTSSATSFHSHEKSLSKLAILRLDLFALVSLVQTDVILKGGFKLP